MQRRVILAAHLGKIPRARVRRSRRASPSALLERVDRCEIEGAVSVLEIAPEARSFDGCADDAVVVFEGDRGRALPVAHDDAILNWLHFRNYRHSPFARTPKNLKTALKRWRSYAAAPQRITKPGDEPISFCFLCGKRVEDVDAHKASEGHAERVRNADFSEFDRLKAELEKL